MDKGISVVQEAGGAQQDLIAEASTQAKGAPAELGTVLASTSPAGPSMRAQVSPSVVEIQRERYGDIILSGVRTGMMVERTAASVERSQSRGKGRIVRSIIPNADIEPNGGQSELALGSVSDKALIMTLRSASAKDRRSHDRLKCHYCKCKLGESGHLMCEGSADCECAFCYVCLQDHFNTEILPDTPAPLKPGWVCLVCRGLCSCPNCQAALLKKAASPLENRDSPHEANEATILVKRWRYMPFLRTETEFHGPKLYGHHPPKDYLHLSVSKPNPSSNPNPHANANLDPNINININPNPKPKPKPDGDPSSPNDQYKSKLRRRDAKRAQPGWGLEDADGREKEHRASLELYPAQDDEGIPLSLAALSTSIRISSLDHASSETVRPKSSTKEVRQQPSPTKPGATPVLGYPMRGPSSLVPGARGRPFLGFPYPPGSLPHFPPFGPNPSSFPYSASMPYLYPQYPFEGLNGSPMLGGPYGGFFYPPYPASYPPMCWPGPGANPPRAVPGPQGEAKEREKPRESERMHIRPNGENGKKPETQP